MPEIVNDMGWDGPFKELEAEAQPRPDIGEKEPVFTFAGRVVKKGETPEEVLKRTPTAELESASRTATAPLDLLMGYGLSKGAVGLATHPAQTAQAARTAVQGLRGFPSWWRGQMDKLGETILEATPKYFRSGRGAPIEFRETIARKEADTAYRMEQALELGEKLGPKNLTQAERLRADQLLRGGITTSQTPQKVVEASAEARKVIDEIQQELVSLGRLSPEVVERFEENFGPYLARLYATKEFTPSPAVLPFPKPVRAGTPRLMQRGDRVTIEIPSLEKEMNAMARLLGPESEFRRVFRERAKELGTRRETTTTTAQHERVIPEQRTSTTQTTTSGGEGEFTQVPLSGIAARLEKVVTDALQTRGMTLGEAEAAVGRVKAAAVRASQGGPEVTITGGGTTTQRTTETIKQTVEREKETIRSVIEGLGINKAQQAALHAYYDTITRAAMKTKSIQAGGKTYRVAPIMDPDSGIERVDSLKQLLADGWKVEKRSGNNVTLFRDIPEETRKAMGEMRSEPGYVAAKSIAQTGREAAVVRFFQTISRNPEWSSAVDPTPAPLHRAQMGAGAWVKMPDDKKRLADLAGRWVRPDIAAEIDEVTRIKGDWEKISGKVTSLWKQSKIYNAGTIARNFMSSAELARWGGLSYANPRGVDSYQKAIMGLLGKDPEAVQWLAEAKRAGLYLGTWDQNEINRLASGFIASKEKNPILRALDGIQNIVDKTHLPEVYGSVDNFYKSALYVHNRRIGLNPQMALREAKKWAIDYGDVSPFARTMRNVPLGTPFITFTAKAIPLFFETAVKHPIRAFGLPMTLFGISEFSKSGMNNAERQQLEKTQEIGSKRSPRFVTLPGKGPDGRFRFLDMGYIFPQGDLIEAWDKMRGGEGANLSFELGGPFMSVLEVYPFNKNTFTGKEIVGRNDGLGDAAAKISDHLGKALLPAWAPPIPFTGFRGGYSTETFRRAIPYGTKRLPGEAPIALTDFLGRRPTFAGAVASKILGIKVDEVSLQDAQRLGLISVQQKLDDLSRQIAKTSMMDIPQPEKQKIINDIGAKYRELSEEVRKKFTGQLKESSGQGIKNDLGWD